MIKSLTLTAQTWTKVATGPHSLFWALGHVRFSFGEDAPTNTQDSLHMVANGQVRGLTYNGSDAVWAYPIERTVHLQFVQISASELFLIDADGNVVVDAGGLRP